MRYRYILAFCLAVLTAAFAQAQSNSNLSIDSQFVDQSGQTPQLCVHFTEPLKPGIDSHYEDYVQVGQFSNIVALVTGHTLCIGGLPYQRHYSVTLLPGLPARNGDTLGSPQTLEFSLADRPPTIAITGNGLYLAKRSATGLGISTVNVHKLVIHILRLNDLNAIQDFAANAQNSVLDPATQTMQEYGLDNLISGQAGVVWSGTMAVQGQPDTDTETAFPIVTALGQSQNPMAGKPGVYLVVAENAAGAVAPGFWTGNASANDMSYASNQSFATHWVVVTDIGLTALRGQDGLNINVRSIAQASPMSGIRLDLISQGGDVLTSVTSDANGNAAIGKPVMDGILANAPLAVAAYGPDGDFSYLPLDRSAFDLSDRGVAGRPAPQGDDAYIFADRGIYRPGETVKAGVLLRNADGAALTQQKFNLVLVRTDTLQVLSLPAVTDDAGGAAVDVPIPANALRGPWTLRANIDPTLPAIGSLNIEVQNFQPADLRITASGAPALAAPGDTVRLVTHGEYLYGAPASLLPVNARVIITADPQPFKNVQGYSFGLYNDTPADQVSDIENNGADASGTMAVSTTMPSPNPTTVPLRAIFDLAYQEPDGNLTHAKQITRLITSPILLGIKPLFQGAAGDSGAAAAFELAAFDSKTGAMLAAPSLQMRLVRTDEVFDWVTQSGSTTWQSYDVDHPVELSNLALAGAAPTGFSRTLPDGDYTLIISDPKTGAASSVQFNVGWSGIGSNASTPDMLTLTTDHATLDPGGNAAVHISAPFPGQADLYVANDRVYSHQEITVPKGGADASVTADGWNGGAYVIADLHRGSAGVTGHASVRAIGVGWIGLNNAAHTLRISVQAPETVRPRTRQTVKVQVANLPPGRKAHLIVYAVDEGILGLTNYATPDPLGWFWGQRALGVEIRDIYGSLLNSQGMPGELEQGGDEGAGGPRLPMQSTRVFALATADLETGPDGTLQIPIDVPDFEGQARISAIAWTADAAGSASSDMVVRDPVVVMPGLPGFLSAGDEIQLPVTLTNIEGPAGAYLLKLHGVGFTRDPAPVAVTLGKAGQQILRLPLTAGAPGIARITLTLTGPGGTDITRSFAFSIRAAHPPALLSLFGPIAKGAVLDMPAPLLKSGAATGTARLAATGFPGLDQSALLNALRQDADASDTVSLLSQAFPLLIPGTDAAWPGGQDAARKRVENAISTLINRTDISGDIGQWSFSDSVYNDWTTAYALDFLFAAQQAGFNVPQDALARGASWLRAEAGDLQSVITNQDTAYGSAIQCPFSDFVYIEWLLARTGKGDIGTLRVVADALKPAQTPDGSPIVFWGGGTAPGNLAAPGDLAKLAMALRYSGDPARAQKVLALAAKILGTKGSNGWTDAFFWTPNQDAAIFLYAAATLNQPQLYDAAAKHLDPAALLADQDDDAMAWLLRAAAQMSGTGSNAAPVDYEFAGGKSVLQPGVVAAELPWKHVLAGAPVTFLDGKGYYAFTADYTPGIAAPAYAHFMVFNAQYLSLRTNQPVDLTKLHQGQDIVVVISGIADAKQLHEFHIVALLPGCFAIEKAMPGPSEIKIPLSGALSYRSDVDRFLATVQLGTPDWDQNNNDNNDNNDNDGNDSGSGSNQAPKLPPGHFAVAYVAKVTAIGSFTLPEVTVRDRLHPALNAATAAQSLTVSP